MDRRSFLKKVTAGTAALAISSRTDRAADKEHALEGAADRIEKHRKADAVLNILAADGKQIKAGSTVKIEQKRHKFLFGCNIFKLHQCRTPQDNADYE